MRAKAEIPVGWDQTRRGYVVTCELPYSRAFAGALVFSKEFPDIAWGMSRCLARLGALPQKLVWDREGAIAPRGRPTEPFLAFCGQLALGWNHPRCRRLPGQGRARARPPLPARQLRGRTALRQPARLQDQLDRWTDKINARTHRTTRAVVSERLRTERDRMRELPAALPGVDRRWVVRVPPQPYLRLDRNDYSLDPRLVGRRVEVRAGQSQITATSLDTGQLASGASSPVGSPSPSLPTRPRSRSCRGERKRRRSEPEVEIRPLVRYDRLIPA